ncbi:MAG: MBL fold metallo-hydrolase [Desulfatiglandales bacterium]
MPIQEADRVTITTVMDNYTDVFLIGSDYVKRWGPPDMIPGKTAAFGDPPPLLAEHGLSLLVEVFKGEERLTLLFDTGFTDVGVPYNLQKLGIETAHIDAIVFSHGHPDHTAAIGNILTSSGRNIPLITHPFAFRKRYLVFPDGNRVLSNTLSEESLIKAGADIRLSSDLLPLAPFAFVTGEIDMVNDFELHFPLAHYEENGKLEKDFFEDEKSLVINVKNKGLIVITGCGHRGVMNTIAYAKRLSGVDRIHAVIGGFHLTGTTTMEKISRTVEEMERVGPDFIIPTHCTGLRAMKQFADAMPERFILNAVGTKFMFGS